MNRIPANVHEDTSERVGRERSTTPGLPDLSDGRSRSRRFSLALIMCAALSAGCDNLLDVALPGAVTEQDLDDIRFIPLIAESAEGSFECAFSSYVLTTGMFATDFWVSGITRVQNILGTRLEATRELFPFETSCVNSVIGWLPLNESRVLAKNAIERIAALNQPVVDEDFWLAKSHMIAGYSYQLLGEAFCELAFDGDGPLVTRAQTFRFAEDHFSNALSYAAAVTSGARQPEASSIATTARIGRARARLNLGDGPGTIADASLVPMDFHARVTRSALHPRRYNRVFDHNNLARNSAVHSSYWALTVDGVPDPRVPVVFHGFGAGSDGVTEVRFQQKYTSRASFMPFASGREAQLMIAEVQGGQEAVGIINMLRDTYDLPHFASSDLEAIRAQVIEERRRELWLQGTRLGDMIRLDIPFVSGSTPQGEPYGPLTCIPLPDVERVGNPNVPS